MQAQPLPDGLSWAPFSNGDVPKNAVQGGLNLNDKCQWFYIGRAGHEGDLVCGKIHCSYGFLYIPYDQKEHRYRNYEVLVQDTPDLALRWQAASGGHVPLGAVPGGWSTETKEALFIGRTLKKHEGDIVPGKIHPTKGTLYYSYGGKEHKCSEYEVLVVDEIDMYEFLDVRYDLRKAVMSDDPVSLGTIRCINEDPKDQQVVTVKKSFQTTHSKNWGNQVGLKVGVKTSLKCGVPLLAEGKVEVSGEGYYTHSWGSAESKSETNEVTAQRTVPPLHEVVATVVAKQAKCDVPYTATAKVMKQGQVIETKRTSGVYHGVQCHSFEVQYLAAKPLPGKARPNPQG